MADLNAKPEGVKLQGRWIDAGTVVHLYGIPVRLVSGVNIETSEGNLHVIDDRALGVQLASELSKVPPLSTQLPPANAAPPYVPPPAPKEDINNVLEYLRQKEQDAEKQRQRQGQRDIFVDGIPQPQRSWPWTGRDYVWKDSPAQPRVINVPQFTTRTFNTPPQIKGAQVPVGGTINDPDLGPITRIR
jgi:hypothetical protein